MRSHLITWLGLITAALIAAGCEAPPAEEPQDEPQQPQVQRKPVPAPEPRDGLIPVNRPAPDFEATDQFGRRVVLSDLLENSNVVLIFYPADFTPGCTKQLCKVRDDWVKFQRRGALVLGVNPAGATSHAQFAEQHELPFPILVDAGGRIAAGYGAAGSNPAHPQRTVYVIRKNGRVGLAERGMVSHDKIFAALDRP